MKLEKSVHTLLLNVKKIKIYSNLSHITLRLSGVASIVLIPIFNVDVGCQVV